MLRKSILVISDQHAPYHHIDTLDFLSAIKEKYKPDCVVNIGDIVRNFPSNYSIKSLAAGKNIIEFKKQLIEFQPEIASITDPKNAKELELFCKKNNLKTTIFHGNEGLDIISKTAVDLIIIAIVGTAGIRPTYNAIQEKIPIALACKEVLVSAGDLITELAQQNKVPIIPIDSEHAATQQCINTQNDLIPPVNTLSIPLFLDHDAIPSRVKISLIKQFKYLI